MSHYVPKICGTTKRTKSARLLKDFDEKGFTVKKDQIIAVDLISSDIAYSDKYKRHLTVGTDIELL